MKWNDLCEGPDTYPVASKWSLNDSRLLLFWSASLLSNVLRVLWFLCLLIAVTLYSSPIKGYAFVMISSQLQTMYLQALWYILVTCLFSVGNSLLLHLIPLPVIFLNSVCLQLLENVFCRHSGPGILLIWEPCFSISLGDERELGPKCVVLSQISVE